MQLHPYFHSDLIQLHALLMAAYLAPRLRYDTSPHYILPTVNAAIQGDSLSSDRPKELMCSYMLILHIGPKGRPLPPPDVAMR
jgi:hypothetical protein